jgi:hypothetical protein
VAAYRGGRKASGLRLRTGQRNVIAERLIAARHAQTPPWTQERLCIELELRAHLTLEQATVGKIERQTRGVYDFEIIALALTLGVSSDWLLGITDSGGPRNWSKGHSDRQSTERF